MNTSPQFSSARLKRAKEQLDRHEKGRDPEDVLLDNGDLQQFFRISKRTTYNWRKKGLIKHVLIEGRVFYRLSEIRKFLDMQTQEKL